MIGKQREVLAIDLSWNFIALLNYRNKITYLQRKDELTIVKNVGVDTI